MRLEHEKGSFRASHARRTFLRAIRENLPQKAFAELDLMPMQREKVEGWADSHGINAPCVVEAFLYFCEGGWSKHGRIESDSWDGPKIPREWSKRLAELNARPIDPWAWRGVDADESLLNEVWRGRKMQSVRRDLVKTAFDRHLGPICSLSGWRNMGGLPDSGALSLDGPRAVGEDIRASAGGQGVRMAESGPRH